MSAAPFLRAMLGERLAATPLAWLDSARTEIGGFGGEKGSRFATLIAQAARAIPRGPLAPTQVERGAAADLVPGWNPERWRLVDAARAALVLARPDLDRPSGPASVEDCFRYADVGELTSLYRALCLLPQPLAWVWRAGEGCRSSMSGVFEAAACDTPFPFHHFDPIAWRQLALKAVFTGAPLWRVHGLDQRIDDELARMALDLADERRAAGRAVQPELWLCLGRHGGARGLASLAHELEHGEPAGRACAAVALARAGELARLASLRELERDARVARAMESALKGFVHQSVWQDLLEQTFLEQQGTDA